MNNEHRLVKRIEAGHRPPGASPEIVEFAPARGAVVPVELRDTYVNADGEVETIDAGVHGLRPVRRLDVFDRMHDQLTPAQVAMGRHYRDLVERHASAGVRCSSIEAVRSGGSGQGSFIDAVLRDREKIRVIHDRIGTGAAMAVRRVRPSSRGSRVTIMDRRLVDMVCLEDRTISEVLRAHGWCEKGQTRRALRQALADCLDRMAGPVVGQRLQSAVLGPSPGELGFEEDPDHVGRLRRVQNSS